MSTRVFKMQRPLETNDPAEPWLFYDHGRRMYDTQRPPIDKEKRAMGPARYKMFGYYHKIGDVWVFQREAPAQDW